MFAVPILLADVWQYVFGILMFLTSLFLILLVLVQRGRGGGLAGAFGGMGGQSAFGTKAGDLFTRITIGVAFGWILLCMGAILVLNRQTSVFGDASVFDSTTVIQADPDQADPDQADPDQADPDQADPDQADPDQAEGGNDAESASPPAEGGLNAVEPTEEGVQEGDDPE